MIRPNRKQHHKHSHHMHAHHMQPHGMRPHGMNPHRMQPRCMNPHGMQPRCMNPHGMRPHGMQPRCMNPHGMRPHGMRPHGMRPHSMQPRCMNPHGMHRPFREMEKFERAFFRAPFRSCSRTPFRGFSGIPAHFQFRTEVTDAGDHYLLEVDLPGFEKENISLNIRGDKLIVHAQRKPKVEEKDEAPRKKRSCGRCIRCFNLSCVDADNIKAQYTQGVLRLTLPKLAQPASEDRRLEIE